MYNDNAIDEIRLVRNNQDNDFDNINLTSINSTILNTQAVNDGQIITKAYVDQFHNDNERTRRDLELDFYNESGVSVKNNQDNDFNDKKLTNLGSNKINRAPISDNEIANKKCVDDSIGEDKLVEFNQTHQNYLKVSVGNYTYNLAKYKKIQVRDTTIMNAPKICGFLSKQWNIKRNDKNIDVKIQNFLRSTKKNNPTSDSGATNLSVIGDSFMYIETSSDNHGNNVFVSCEQTDIIQFTNINFYYNRFSILTNDSINSVGRFTIQSLLEYNTWSTRYKRPKNDRYSDTSTDWTLVSLNFTEKIMVLNKF